MSHSTARTARPQTGLLSFIDSRRKLAKGKPMKEEVSWQAISLKV